MEAHTIVKVKRSEALTKVELAALKKYRKGFDTEVACAITLGMDRNVLNRIILAGSGSPENIEKIRTLLNGPQK